MMIETALLERITAKKAELDRLRPQAPHGLDNRNRSQDIELTYRSNAIEGNTLTAAETRMVIVHGITIGGEPLKDHLEAVDHFEALHYARDLAAGGAVEPIESNAPPRQQVFLNRQQRLSLFVVHIIRFRFFPQSRNAGLVQMSTVTTGSRKF